MLLSSRIARRSPSSVRMFSASHRVFQPGLSYQVFGPEKDESNREPIVFLHGLFGSKQNNRSISRVLARDLNRQVFTLDLRNHGDSFHHPKHNYSVMAEDVVTFLHQQKMTKCILIGHSMGAKAAMMVALESPNLVSALIPVDNAPISAPFKSDFGKYIRGMQHIEAEKVTKQSDADKILQSYEKSLPIRQFLLTNLVRSPEDQTLNFRVPLSIIGESLYALAEFPFQVPGSVQYDGPTLFIRGTRSRYVTDKSISIIKAFFPNSQIADVEAGHWLISENPEAFREVVVEFLGQIDEK